MILQALLFEGSLTGQHDSNHRALDSPQPEFTELRNDTQKRVYLLRGADPFNPNLVQSTCVLDPLGGPVENIVRVCLQTNNVNMQFEPSQNL